MLLKSIQKTLLAFFQGATEGATGRDFPKLSTIFQNNFSKLSEKKSSEELIK